MPGADKETPTMEPWAVGIGLATLALVAAVAIFTAWDRAHTGDNEIVVTPTAVGDTHFVQEPGGGKGPIGLKYQGRSLDMISQSKILDAKLLRESADDTGAYSLYRLEEEGAKKGALFMKVGVNSFIEVTQEQ